MSEKVIFLHVFRNEKKQPKNDDATLLTKKSQRTNLVNIPLQIRPQRLDPANIVISPLCSAASRLISCSGGKAGETRGGSRKMTTAPASGMKTIRVETRRGWIQMRQIPGCLVAGEAAPECSPLICRSFRFKYGGVVINAHWHNLRNQARCNTSHLYLPMFYLQCALHWIFVIQFIYFFSRLSSQPLVAFVY